jgi:cell cycle arrest protein BUB2
MTQTTLRKPWNSSGKSKLPTRKKEEISIKRSEVGGEKSAKATTPKSVKVSKPAPKGGLVAAPSNSILDIVDQYLKLLSCKSQTDLQLRQNVKQLRFLILKHGIPIHVGKHGSLRASVWKILLSSYKIDAIDYIHLVQKGPHEQAEKIQNDTFRTLATDQDFSSVTNDKITRLLNAFCWKSMEQPKSRLINLQFGYVQGMNVLAAPFLYTLPELDAFYAFSYFIIHSCPLYVQPALEGVHCGVKLLEKCLYELDITLYSFLKSSGCDATVYAFPVVMTFSVSQKPFKNVLELWDFYLAYGVHLNVLAIVANMHLNRNEIMSSKRYFLIH